MGMTYTIEKTRNLVHIIGTGIVTDEEMLGCVTKLRSDPNLEPNMNTLSDMRNITVAFTSEGIRSMIHVMDSTSAGRGNAKVAIVVSTDSAFSMGRMFELRADDREDSAIRIFKAEDEAHDWLESAPDSPSEDS